MLRMRLCTSLANRNEPASMTLSTASGSLNLAIRCNSSLSMAHLALIYAVARPPRLMNAKPLEVPSGSRLISTLSTSGIHHLLMCR